MTAEGANGNEPSEPREPRKRYFPSPSSRRVEVEIGDRQYFIEEMNEGKNREFKKQATRIGRLVEGARSNGGEFPDEGLKFNVMLLSMCMYEVTGRNGEGLPTYRLVTQDFLDTLPASIVEVLDEDARRINNLNVTREQAREEAKNS